MFLEDSFGIGFASTQFSDRSTKCGGSEEKTYALVYVNKFGHDDMMYLCGCDIISRSQAFHFAALTW